jgi:hypothetical protein
VLSEVAAAALPDGAWLRAVGAWADAQSSRSGATADEGELQIAGIIVFEPG